MGAAAENFPLRDAEAQVLSLVCETLKEYECLEHCVALKKYVEDSVRVAWRLVCQVPEYELDTGESLYLFEKLSCKITFNWVIQIRPPLLNP